MYILKYANRSIVRSLGRNLLIGFIIFTITVSSVIALTIRSSADNIIALQEDQFETEATLLVDRNLLRANFGSNSSMREILSGIEPLSLEDIKYYGESQYVNNITYNLSFFLNGEEILPVGSEIIEDDSVKQSSGSSSQNRGDFSLIGYTNPDEIAEFIDGDFVMVEGSVYSLFESTSNVLISEELALLNDLEINDVIKVFNPLNSEESYELNITGTFMDLQSGINPNSSSDNRLLTNYALANDIKEISTINPETTLTYQLNHIFYLNDTSSIENFKNEIFEKGINEYYSVRTNLQDYEKLMQPLNNLIRFSNLFLWIVLAVGGIILLTINMINIRERKYEIGVLRAMGMKKGRVATQFIAELFIVALIAMAIGIGVGTSVSEPTANYMLSSEIQQLIEEEETVQRNMGNGGGMQSTGNITSGDLNFISEIKTPVNTVILIQIILIGLSTVLIGSLISLIAISRYEPLKILSTRS